MQQHESFHFTLLVLISSGSATGPLKSPNGKPRFTNLQASGSRHLHREQHGPDRISVDIQLGVRHIPIAGIYTRTRDRVARDIAVHCIRQGGGAIHGGKTGVRILSLVCDRYYALAPGLARHKGRRRAIPIRNLWVKVVNCQNFYNFSCTHALFHTLASRRKAAPG